MRRAVKANPLVWDELTAHMQHSRILSQVRLEPEVLFAYAASTEGPLHERWGENEWRHLALTTDPAVASWVLCHAPLDSIDLLAQNRLRACAARTSAEDGLQRRVGEKRLRRLTDIIALYAMG